MNGVCITLKISPTVRDTSGICDVPQEKGDIVQFFFDAYIGGVKGTVL